MFADANRPNEINLTAIAGRVGNFAVCSRCSIEACNFDVVVNILVVNFWWASEIQPNELRQLGLLSAAPAVIEVGWLRVPEIWKVSRRTRYAEWWWLAKSRNPGSCAREAVDVVGEANLLCSP